jgi:hypothetical protein
MYKVLYVIHILIIIKVWITYEGFHILPTKRKYFIHTAIQQFHSARQKMSDAAQFIAPEIALEEEAINR